MERRRTLIWLWLAVILLAAPTAAMAEGDKVQPIVKFTGIVQSLPSGQIGEALIADQTVAITTTTQIVNDAGALVVGAEVTVIARELADGSLEAHIIHVTNRPGSAKGQKVQIRGLVESLSDSAIVVTGEAIAYDRRTSIHGELTVGAYVKVQAVRSTSGLLATRIQVMPVRAQESVQFVGAVTAIDEDLWTIARRAVDASQATLVGDPGVGDTVQVNACMQDDGTILASKIKVVTLRTPSRRNEPAPEPTIPAES